jgi:hypothetical protein
MKFVVEVGLGGMLYQITSIGLSIQKLLGVST